MSREIKFRAWDKAKSHMCFFGPDFDVDDDQFTLSFITPAGMVPPIGDHDAMKRYELMQYTGLKDKSGVEIYEGDIVVGQGRGFDDRPLVAAWLSEAEDIGWNLVNDRDVQYKVIGNIYENPELLK